MSGTLCSAQEVRDALADQGYEGAGERWQCPAHTGKKKGYNLSITEGSDGAARLKCWSKDCSTTDILTALGLLGRKHGPARRPSTPPPKPAPRRTMQRQARRLWKESSKIEPGTAAHAYIHNRLRWPLTRYPLPKAVRCAPASKVPLTLPDGAAFVIIYGLKASHEPSPAQAVEIDAITAEGKLADPRFRRTLGPKKGAALWLPARNGTTTGHKKMAIAEGPLDALAVFVMRPTLPVAGTMGTSELRFFSPPLETQSVEIWADAGDAGTEAAAHLAERLKKKGIGARISEPVPPAQDPAEELIRRYTAIIKEQNHAR